MQSAHAEPDADARTPRAPAGELALTAGWLGLDRVEVRRKGDLAEALAGAVGA